MHSLTGGSKVSLQCFHSSIMSPSVIIVSLQVFHFRHTWTSWTVIFVRHTFFLIILILRFFSPSSSSFWDMGQKTKIFSSQAYNDVKTNWWLVAGGLFPLKGCKVIFVWNYQCFSFHSYLILIHLFYAIQSIETISSHLMSTVGCLPKCLRFLIVCGVLPHRGYFLLLVVL